MSKTAYKLGEFLANPNHYGRLDFYPTSNNNNYKFTDHDCHRLMSVLKNNNTVTRLYLNQNSIGDSGADAIKQAGSRLGGYLQLQNQRAPGVSSDGTSTVHQTPEEIAAKKQILISSWPYGLMILIRLKRGSARGLISQKLMLKVKILSGMPLFLEKAI